MTGGRPSQKKDSLGIRLAVFLIKNPFYLGQAMNPSRELWRQVQPLWTTYGRLTLHGGAVNQCLRGFGTDWGFEQI